MELLKYIKDNTILVVPPSLRSKLLEEFDSFDSLVSVKIMTFLEFRRRFLFDYGKEAILYLMRKYQMKRKIAIIYLENMYYLNGLYTSSDRLNELTLMKNNLMDHQLLKEDPLFRKSLKQYNVCFLGFDFYRKEEEALIEQVRKITNVQVFQKEVNPPKNLAVYEFETMDEEVEYVLTQMILLHEKGIPFSQMKLVGMDEVYRKVFQKLLPFFPVPLVVEQATCLYETIYGKHILSMLEEGYGFYDILESLERENVPSPLLSKIVSLFQEYQFFTEDARNLISFLTEEMRHIFLEVDHYEEEIETISLLNSSIEDGEYVFVVGFHNGRFPVVQKDEDYLSDVYKEELGVSTSREENKLQRMALMNQLFGISNLTITYCKRDSFGEYNPSILIDDYAMQVVRLEEFPHYSKAYDQLKLTSMLDTFLKYGTRNRDLERLYSSVPISYRTYDSSYQSIDPIRLKEHLDGKLVLSYSSLDVFYRCQFRYYLQYVLKMGKMEDTLSIKLGNVFHAVLSHYYEDDFSFEECYSRELARYSLTKKERFYFEKWKKELGFILATLKEQDLTMGFTPFKTEEKLYVPLGDHQGVEVGFMGILDKLYLGQKNSSTFVSIVDYKTGTADIDLSYAPFGLKLQLPSYMYLLRKSKKWKDAIICGIYLQRLLSTRKQNEKKDSLKLQGYSLMDEEVLAYFDPTYENSSLVRGLKKTKTGWYRYAKLLTYQEMDELIALVEEKVKNAASLILEGDFTINPKRLDGVNVGCEFCSFRDICYQTEKNIVNLEKEETYA